MNNNSNMIIHKDWKIYSTINKQYMGGLPPLSTTQNKVILSQLERCVCKIHKIDGVKATGFLCKIPFSDKFKLLPVLITNNHVLNKMDIQVNKTIKITLGDNEIEKYIKIDEKRGTFTNSNPDIDITIIEIKPNLDGLNYFLDIDDTIFEKNYIQIYQDSPIYILQYPKGRESSHSEGIIYKINKTNIEHSCSVDFGSSGSPILSLSTFKVIGVHKRLTSNFSEGTFMNIIINDFNKVSPIDSNQNINYLQNNNNQINNDYYNLKSNNINKNQIINQRFIGNKANIYNANNNAQIINKPGLPVYNYQFNKNKEYNNNKINNNYLPQNYNNYNYPYNMINNGYYSSNEIANDNDSKEFYKESNGGIVKSYAFYEYEQDIKNKDNIQFKLIENLNEDNNQLLFCLFNGHGGNEVSKFLQENFSNYLKRILPLRDISQDFTRLFKGLDEKIRLLNVSNIGATATVAYIVRQNGKITLYCANVGNNKCLLVNRKGIWRISNEHKINDPEEHKRIIRKGGILNIKQLFGKLNTSRTFGDWNIKKYGGVICEPHISVINLNEEDLYLIIASEKIWKYVKDEEFLQLTNLNKNPLEICKKSFNELLNRGCHYNIGSIIISFK